MQGNNQQGNQGSGQKQGGLSWTQSPSANTNSSQSTVGAKPISQVPPPVTTKPVAASTPISSTNSQQNQNKKMAENKSTTMHHGDGRPSGGRTFGVFAAGIIVGLIVGWGWFSLRTTDNVANTNTNGTATTTAATTNTTNTNKPATTPTSGATSPSSGSLTVTSPQAAGLAVTVSDIAVAVPTWVVVFDNVGGKPGNALGARMFFSGDKSGVVTLLRATNADQTYFVSEYVDNGDHHFSKQTDTQVTGITGSPLMVEFTTK